MAKNYNQSCDNCGTILYGQDRGAFIKKDNIFFNGQAGKNVFDPQSGFHQTVFFTKSSSEQTVFCNPECLSEWMATQEMLYQNRKMARLREEAETGITGQEKFTPYSQRPAYSSATDERPPERKRFGAAPPAPAPNRDQP